MKNTPLTEKHPRSAQRMAEFAGYKYAHLLTLRSLSNTMPSRQAVGVFDVSHMGEFIARASKAISLSAGCHLERCEQTETRRDTVLPACPTRKGDRVDGLLVYRLERPIAEMTVDGEESYSAEHKCQVTKSRTGAGSNAVSRGFERENADIFSSKTVPYRGTGTRKPWRH
jgi:glycine cleavage system aminomethyltransferase T